MLGPSGFFQNIADVAGSPVSSVDLEILYDSEDGFNTLYRGSKGGRFFVYKALKKKYRGNPLYEELLKKDFNIGFTLTHNNICQYYGLVELPELGNCIVMEWIDGCSLEELLSERKPDRKLAGKIICELCDALDYMHRKQIVHRDLKPENILVTYNGQNVKVIDFGLSDADSYNVFKAPAGTKAYASPELLAGESVDSRTDIWSLGVIINEISGYYRHTASRCLNRKLDKRISTASDVKKSILNTARTKFMVSLILVLTISSVLAGALWMYRHAEPVAEPEPVISEPVIQEVPQADSVVMDVPVSNVPVKENVAPPLPEKTSGQSVELPEQIDADALDDLFKEAAEKIL